jgi:hypothetical protein
MKGRVSSHIERHMVKLRFSYSRAYQENMCSFCEGASVGGACNLTRCRSKTMAYANLSLAPTLSQNGYGNAYVSNANS